MKKILNAKIVAIGGGHGLGRMLAALKEYGSNVTGIVATTDNGGSTGRIRECQGGIAWGDTRNCINQLITEPNLSSMLFEYRFKGSGELAGHNMGNLILTALNNLSVRPLDAIRLVQQILKVDVNILPMSEHPADLVGLSHDGKWIRGETDVDDYQKPLRKLFIEPEVPATREAIIATENADYIILGPGSFLTSIMPPLLLPEIGKAIEKNQKAKLIFIDNLSHEYGPAGQMPLDMKLAWCQRACCKRQIDLIIGQTFSKDIQAKYTTQTSSLASNHVEWRHDREKLKKAISQYIENTYIPK